MRKINKIYIDGSFITPHGNEQFDLYNPAIATIIGHVQLADAVDARHANVAWGLRKWSWSRLAWLD